MPSHHFHKPVLNSGGIHHRVDLLLRASNNAGHEKTLRRTPGSGALVTGLERRSILRRLARHSAWIVALTAVALVVGAAKGGWRYALILGLVALIQAIALLTSSRAGAIESNDQ